MSILFSVEEKSVVQWSANGSFIRVSSMYLPTVYVKTRLHPNCD